MIFQARRLENGMKTQLEAMNPTHTGTPPKKQGVVLCQRSSRGRASQPLRRQILIVQVTSAAVTMAVVTKDTPRLIPELGGAETAI